MKKQKRVRHSIRSKIIATAVCPLIAMSTAVSVLAINDYDAMFVANIIAVILFVGIVQVILVSNGIVKSVRMAEEYLNQLSERHPYLLTRAEVALLWGKEQVCLYWKNWSMQEKEMPIYMEKY